MIFDELLGKLKTEDDKIRAAELQKEMDKWAFLNEEKQAILEYYGHLTGVNRNEIDETASVKIEISQEEKKPRTFGKYTPAKVLEKIREVLDDPDLYEDCPCIYLLRKSIDNQDKSAEQKINEIEELLDKHEAPPHCEKTCEKIKRILQCRRTESALLGEFFLEDFKIVLYERTIWKDSEWMHQHGGRLDGVNLPLAGISVKQLFLAYLSMVLAHELLHAAHYIRSARVNSVDALWNGKGPKKEKTELKEALADFFAVDWCMFKGQGRDIIGNRRYEAWEKHRYSSWPYARAREFFRGLPLSEINQVEDKFKEIYKEACGSFWDYAHKQLVRFP